MAEKTLFKTYGCYTSEELKKMEQAERNYLEDYGNTEEGEFSDQNIADIIAESINMSFDDERMNLDKELEGRILCIADVGTWRGRFSGYKILGNNLSDIVSPHGDSIEDFKIYMDGRNVYWTGHHHDGVNHVEFREIREDRNIENLLDKLYNQEEVTRKEINYYTRSIRPYIKEIYGI